jgi:oxaloacetate decarboxylase alpha subunit
MSKPIAITELVLRDAHQSLFATRLRLEDMLPIAKQLDNVGYWSVESWGGATFDACIRYLGEDPWERIRALKAAMPKTKQQMLLRGQNLLGYRHYADDVVRKFVHKAHTSGVDVFRIFDAMNDVRNLQTAIEATLECGAHAQGTLSYTVSPVHSLETWLSMAKQLEDKGVQSICVKDMAGLLKPYDCELLIQGLKAAVKVPIALHCHATTGLSTASYQKAIDAGVDMIDSAISPMSMTYGHTATETVVAMLQNTERDTGLSLKSMEPIAHYFREVRKKYAQFEGSLKGVDARILVAQVPGGMLTNMENQLKEQGAEDKFDEVLQEIPKVRKDLGYIPLVTPTSQIVGTQAVLNVLSVKRYKSVSKETVGILKGEYGRTAAPVNTELQQRVLDGKNPITCRPADLIDDEFDDLSTQLSSLAKQQDFSLSDAPEDDVLTYALFPQVGLHFLKNRHDPMAFEAKPDAARVVESNDEKQEAEVGEYDVTVDGHTYKVVVGPSGSLSQVSKPSLDPEKLKQEPKQKSQTIQAPLAGTLVRVTVKEQQLVKKGEVLAILEAMKMETEIRSPSNGCIAAIAVKEGNAVSAGQPLFSLV